MVTDESPVASKPPAPAGWRVFAPLGVAIAAFSLAYMSLVFTRDVGRIAAVWPANALILAVLLRSAGAGRWRHLFAGLAGLLAADVRFGDPVAIALPLTLCNGIEIALCAAFMRRLAGARVDLSRQKDLLLFLLAAGVLGPATSASLASWILGAAQHTMPHYFRTWYGADALGLLIVTPTLLALTAPRLTTLARRLGQGRGLASAAVLAFSLVVVFGQSHNPLFFLVPPALIFVAFELGVAGAAIGLLVTCVTAVVMTLVASGPAALIGGSLADRLAVLQLFLATMSVAVLPVAAALARRERLEGQLRLSLAEMAAARQEIADNEARYRLLAESATDVILKIDRDDIIQYISPSVRCLGRDPQDMIGRPGSSYIHPEDFAAARARMVVLRAGGAVPPADNAYRVSKADGSWLWMEANSTAVMDEAGVPCGVVTHLRDVSERRAAMAAVAESEARYRLLADSTTDIVLKVDCNDIINYVSPSARRYGYEPEDLIGKSGFALVHPEDLPKLQNLIGELFSGAEVDPARDRTYRIVTASGDYVWMEGNPAIVRDGDGAPIAVISQLRDVSDRLAAAGALAESEHRHRLIAENATDIISRMGIDGRVNYFSPSVTDVTGYSVAEVTRASMIPLLHAEDIEPTLAAYRQIIAGRPLAAPLAYRLRHKDGHWLWLEGTPILVRDAAGAPSEIIDVRRDVTAKVRLEAELRAAKNAADDAVAVKSAFVANMSHEIRTPLTSILGFTSLLSQSASIDATARGYVDRVAGAGHALLAIVNDILDFSKLEAGQVSICPKPTATSDLLRDALLMFTPQAQAKGLELEFEADEAMPPCLLIDPDRVRQMLLNLIGNAVKFTERGSVRLTSSYDAVAGRLEVRVRDTGPSMTRVQQRKLFQRFSQVDASSTRQHGGTGLGLAISQGLAEAMGGDIGVDSKRGVGSTFHFRIAAPVAQFPAANITAAAQLSIEGLRLLVVDDNQANRELAKAILTPFGVEVAQAVDGQAAIEAASREPFDVILMDLRMPGLDGPSAANAIRAGSGPNRDAPILAFSADADLERFENAASGFDGIVRKPIATQDLLAALANLYSEPTLTAPEEAIDAAAR